MRKRQWFAFYVHDGGLNQLGQPMGHWEVTLQYHTKAEVFKAYNRYRGHRKVREVFTMRQLVEKYPREWKCILEERRPHILADKEKYENE